MDMSNAATCLVTLRKVKDISTFLATRNATFSVAVPGGVTREIFLATCLATFVARQVARKIASCNMAFRDGSARCLIFIGTVHSVALLSM